MNALNEYMLFFRGPDWDQGLTVEETQAIMDRIGVWTDSVSQKGKVKGGQVLERVGTVVSSRQGQIVTDGPFAESKEAIGGYLAVELADYDEALALAKTFPTLPHGISIEIRKVLAEC